MNESSLYNQLKTALSGSYAVERELPRGGMARVFLAEEIRLGRKVVIKILPSDLAAEISNARFAREIVISAGLQHPQIIPVLNAGEAGGLPYYVMPYVEGEALGERIARQGPLPVRDAIWILRDVAKALAFAHDKGVVHRDIKPGNVLLSGDSAVVTDFGIAKAIGAARTSNGGEKTATLTGLGVTVGTPGYMAPEQLAGDPAVDLRADVYSFGCLAYEMMAGRPPFEGASVQKVLVAHLTEAPTPLCRLRPDCPRELEDLVMRCLGKDPSSRPQSAAEILTALDTVPAAGGPRIDKVKMTGLAALVVVTLLASSLFVSQRGGTKETDAPTIAVLPFRSLDGDSAAAYFGRGIAEELGLSLQRLPGLRVAAQGSAAAVRERQMTMSEIGKALDAETILDGTVRHSGGRLRVTATLVDAADGRVVWSDAFDRESGDVFALQEDLARSIVRPLQIRLTDAAKPSAFRGTKSVAAYDHHLRGRFAITQGYLDLKAVPSAVSSFEKAIAEDSTFARAFSGYADALGLLPYFSGTSFDSIIGPMTRAAQQAIALDPDLGEAHGSLARAFFYQARWSEAEQEIRKSIALDPRWAPAHNTYASILCRQMRIDECIREATLASELEPLAATFEQGLASTFILAGRPADAETHLRRAIKLDSTIVVSGTTQLVLLALGKYDEVVQLWTRAQRARGELVYALAKLGRLDDARAALRRLEGGPSPFGSEDWRRTQSMVIAYIGVADTARALDHLEKGAGGISNPMFRSLGDPVFDPLRPNPRFAAFVRRVGDDPKILTAPTGGRPQAAL